jgi:hypothetical protein
MHYISYHVDNYFDGYQSISLDGPLLIWWNRDTEDFCLELTTLGMDGVE